MRVAGLRLGFPLSVLALLLELFFPCHDDRNLQIGSRSNTTRIGSSGMLEWNAQ
jgi:hypothetical protein